MDPVVAVARQLVDAFTDALGVGDAEGREYAEEQLDEFIDELDDTSPDEAFVALLDLPLDGSTLPLLNAVSRKLARRGPGVVEPLLDAALRQAPPEIGVRDIVSIAGAVGALLEAATRRPDLPVRTENAISVMHAMAQGDLILGLIEVLEGPADERLKHAAGEMLVQIGEPAVERLEMSLSDRDAQPWVADILVDIREEREYGDDDPTMAADGDLEPDEAADEDLELDGVADDDLEPDDDPAAGDAREAGATTDAGDEGAATSTVDPAGGAAPLPVSDDIDRGYDAFLERFKRETGQR